MAMPRRPLARALVVGALALAATTAVPRASAGFSDDEQARLDRGELVVAPVVYERGERTFVGGVSYFEATAPIERLSVVARDPSRLKDLLPAVEQVELRSISTAGVAKIHVRHKLGFTHGGYTFLCLFQDHGRYGRFWLDPTADNVLADAWGFIRLTPLPNGRTLVTYGLLFDLGPGMLRALFEGKIRKAALEYPRRLAHAT